MATLAQLFGQYGKDPLSSGLGTSNTTKSGVTSPVQFQASAPTGLVATRNPQPTQQPVQSPFVTRKPTPQQNGVPTPAVETSPTIADLYRDVNIPQLDDTETDLDRALARQAEFGRKQSMEKFDERAIRDDVMARYQAEIDALNQIYAQQRAEVQQQGTGTLGSARAIQARSGLLGSDFAQAQTSNIERDVQRQVQLVDAEKSAKINALLGQGRAAAAQEIADKRKSIQEGLQSYVQYLGAQQERKQTKLAGLAQSLIDQGIRPDEISPEQIKEIAKTYGVLEQDIASAYTAREKELLAEQREVGGDPFTLSEGESRFFYNPTTGQYEQVAAGAPKTDSAGKMTESQGKAATFANRMQGAETIIAELENKFRGIGSYVGQNLPNPLKSDERQKLEQAQINFLTAVLRRESGATILPSEFEMGSKQYFPQPGDSQAVLEQKRKNREATYQGMLNEAGSFAINNSGSNNITSGGDSVFAEDWSK